MKKIKLNDIRIDGGTQGRAVIDQPTVYSYRDHMNEGDEFPPMDTVYDGTTYWLIDGFHRYHAYKLMGIKEIEVNYKPGTLEEAQVLSFGMNGKHGKPRTNADKRKVVEEALQHPLTKDKTMYEISKICHVSQPFVASIKSPESKKKQEESKKKHITKKAEELNTNPISNSDPTTNQTPDPMAGAAPDEDEIRASELAQQADMEAMYKLLESDDALQTAHEEIQRLNHLNAQLEIRINGLMNEKNEAIKLVKKLQKENDKLKGKK